MQPEDMILVSVDDHLRSFDHGRFERTAGASLGSVSAKLDV